ncbi:hypothetical protein [Pelistega ratti]|uniref:hypothetical protein n=1 Tax=Pelistega ratti TaxID=2652177 RepID=UPI001356F174|nr:hypothetical protein [Pelistega ratti]
MEDNKVNKIIVLGKIVVLAMIAIAVFIITFLIVSNLRSTHSFCGVGCLGDLVYSFFYAGISATIAVILGIIYFVKKKKR